MSNVNGSVVVLPSDLGEHREDASLTRSLVIPLKGVSEDHLHLINVMITNIENWPGNSHQPTRCSAVNYHSKIIIFVPKK